MYTGAQELLDGMMAAAPNVNPASLAGSLYQQALKSAVIAAAHEASYTLLDALNEFCAQHDVQYFAIADTLVGAHSYDDFIPGSTSLEIGMLRAQYERFEQAYYEAGGHNELNYPYASPSRVMKFSRSSIADKREFGPANDDAVTEIEDDERQPLLRRIAAKAGAVVSSDADEPIEMPMPLGTRQGAYSYFVQDEVSALPFTLASHYDKGMRHHRRLPLLRLPGYTVVTQDGQFVFGLDHLPIKLGVSITISVFDAIPDDYDFTRALYQELKMLRRLAQRNWRVYRNAPAQLRNREWELAGSYNGKPHREVARLTPSRSKSILLEDIAPTKMHAFGPTQIACPARGDVWVVEDVDVQSEQVKILQHDAATIIREIDRICRAHDIGYFICGGTMLGYVRHGGFIPWDDDMDIGMLRADYQKFLEVAPAEIDAEKFFLQTRESDPKIPYLFSKVRMKDSEYITKYNQFRDFDKGICVDIFPFDRVPFETGDLPAFRDVVKSVTREHNKVANRQVGDMPSTEPETLRQRIQREIMSTRHDWYHRKSLADTQRAYEQTVMQFNDNENFHFVASFVPTFTMVCLEDLLPYQDVDFGGMTLKCPAKPEVFLQMQYGDFMTLPQPHQQRGHGLIWWSDPERSCEEFGVVRPDHAPVEHHSSKLLKYGPATIGAAGAAAMAFLVRKVSRGR